MGEKQQTTAIVILSVVVGILLVMLIGLSYTYYILDSEWVREYNELDREWCEIYNDYSEAFNEAIDWLIYYDSEGWSEFDKAEKVEC